MFMKRLYSLTLALLLATAGLNAQSQEKTVTITTNVGIMKARLYDDVPNHVRTFISRARQGEFNGTLFTRVIKEFMIQGGAPDSKNAPAGARCGFGDSSAEIMPELKVPMDTLEKGLNILAKSIREVVGELK